MIKRIVSTGGIILSWRIGLYLIASVAPYFFSYAPTFPYANELQQLPLPAWLFSWANFDGVHYLTIVQRGYLEVGFIQAFFPVWPLLLRVTWFLTGSLAGVVLSGQLLATACLFGVLLWWPLFAQTFCRPAHSTNTLSILPLLLFPTAFFFGALYSEALFLLLVLTAYLTAVKQRWWLAGLLAAIASATRVVGIFLVPALFLELANQTNLLQTLQSRSWSNFKKWLIDNKLNLAGIGLGTLGLAAYSGYLWYHFGDPLYFFHVQSEFGGGREETLVLYPQVVWRYLKILATVPVDFRYLTYLQEFGAGVVGLLVLLFGWKKVRFSLWFFSLCALLLPTLTGTFSSLPRYLLAAPAIFLIISAWLDAKPAIRLAWYCLSVGLLILNTMLFIQGYWVA